MNKIKLVIEAKQSYALFMSFTMEMNYHEAMNNDYIHRALLLKWPDVVDDLLNNDDGHFYGDMRILIVKPIEIIAGGLVDVIKMTGSHGGFCDEMNKKIQVIMKDNVDPEHPIIIKTKLIECIDETIVFINTRLNMKIKPIKER